MYAKINNDIVIGLDHISSLEKNGNNYSVVMDSGKEYLLETNIAKELIELITKGTKEETLESFLSQFL